MYGIIRSPWLIFFLSGICSLFLSCWINIRVDVLNPDAICYLQSAQSMGQGMAFVTHLCDQSRWPFYSFLIFCIEKIFPISYLHSAELLNALLSFLSVMSFIAILRYLKANQRVLCFGALVILLAHEFNAVREYIVRDHGFWAFYLLSLLCLLNYFQNRQSIYAVLWGISLAIATLFRVEGIVFLFLLPFLAFFFKNETLTIRIKSFFTLYSVNLIGLGFLAFWVMRKTHHLDQIGRINEVTFQLLNGFKIISENFIKNAISLSQHVLSPYSQQDASVILLLLLVAWYFYAVITNLSWAYGVLVIYALSKKLLRLDKSDQFIFWGYILVNVLITAIFLLENMFLSKRYIMALSLILMLWVPFALENLYQQWNQKKTPFVLAMGFIFLCSLSGIFDFGYSKKYISDAGSWLQNNVPMTSSLYSNDYQVMYYSKHFGNEIFAKAHEFLAKNLLLNDQWKKYDYIAIRFTKHNNEIFQKQTLGQPIQVFANKRGDAVAIYKIH